LNHHFDFRSSFGNSPSEKKTLFFFSLSMSTVRCLTRAVARSVSHSSNNIPSACPFSHTKAAESNKANGAAAELDVDVVRDLLQHPVALAHCPFAQRAARAHGSSDTVPAADSMIGPTTSSLPNHIASLFDAKLRELRDNKHYRTFRYLRRVVGMHPFVAMKLPGSGTASTPVAMRAAGSHHCAEPLHCEMCTCDANNVAHGNNGIAALAAPLEFGERWVVNWCSNDYLNLSHHDSVRAAMHSAIDQQGAGAGGTRNISGSQTVHSALEAELAAMCGHDAALLFNSCYSANLGVMQTLGRILPRDALVLSDQENHASLVEGIRASGLPKVVFRHNDLAHLEQLLAAEPADRVKVVVFESVYSMSGTKADVAAVLDLCERFNAISFIDEVHAVGLYGERGAGVLEEVGQLGRATILSGTLGKAFGTLGGFVTSTKSIIDCVRSTAPSFIFTTSIAPVIASGALAAVRLSTGAVGQDYRKRMRSMAAWLQTTMRSAGLPVLSDASHIVPLLVGDEATCRTICDELLDTHSIYVQPICFPSVPRGEALLRITCSPKHTQLDAQNLVSTLVPLFAKHGVLTAQQTSPHVVKLLQHSEQEAAAAVAAAAESIPQPTIVVPNQPSQQQQQQQFVS
jgi:5-aminolevulinate synthase